MQYSEFLGNVTKKWLLADGGGGTKLGDNCAKQTPGNPSLFELDPGGKPYMDAYWYLTNGPILPNVILFELDVKFPSIHDLAMAQQIECEHDIVHGGVRWDTGIRANFNNGKWGTWDISGHWVDSKLSLPTTQQWLTGVHLVCVATLSKPSLAGLIGSVTRFDGLYVNGVWMPLGLTSKTAKKNAPDHCNMAFQLDGQKGGGAYSCQVATANVRYL